MRFTHTALAALKPKDQRYEVAEAHGFRLRVSPTGKKTFVYRYRFGDKSRVMTLGEFSPDKKDGTLAEAHERHAKARKLLEKGIDPGAKKQAALEAERSAETVAQLAEEYMVHHAKPKKRSWKEDERIIKKEILPLWGNRKAKDITRRDAVLLLDGVNGASMRRCVKSVGSSMFRVGRRRGLVEDNPFIDVDVPSYVPRERVLDDEEIKTLWHAVDGIGAMPAAKLGIKLLLATGQRRGELTKALWENVDLERRIWLIPEEDAKNGHAHTVPLSWLAVRLLKELKETIPGAPYVMTSFANGQMKPYAGNSFSNIPRLNGMFGMPHFTLHDLRRTASTRMRSLEGVDPQHVERILNHLPPMLIRVYDRNDYLDQMTNIMDRWADRLAEIVGMEGRDRAEVIEISNHKAAK